jgi:hypothetical protein
MFHIGGGFLDARDVEGVAIRGRDKRRSVDRFPSIPVAKVHKAENARPHVAMRAVDVMGGVPALIMSDMCAPFRRSDQSKQQQDDQNRGDEPQSPGRPKSPRPAVGPRGKSSKQHQNQDDQQNGCGRHVMSISGLKADANRERRRRHERDKRG